MKRNNVLVIGSLNMDLVAYTDKLPEIGETVLGTKFDKHCGGKGANQAVVAARLSANVSMIGCVGNDLFGQEISEHLVDENVSLNGIKVVDNESSGTALITVDQLGNNSIVVVPGSNHQLLPEDIDQQREQIEWCDVIVLQLEIPINTVYHAIKTGKELGKKIVLNVAPYQPLEKEVYKKIDYLILNETEAQSLIGTSSNEIVDLAKGLTNITNGHVLLTLGEQGLFDIYEGTYKKYEAYKADAIDTTGAGDAFIGALSSMANDENSFDATIRMAMKVASITVQKLGTSEAFPYLEDLKSFEKELKD